MRLQLYVLLILGTLTTSCKPATLSQENRREQTQSASSKNKVTVDPDTQEIITGNDKQMTSKAPTPGNGSPSDLVADVSTSAASARATLNARLSKEMTYANFRIQVIASGWRPVRNPECMADVVGGEFEAMCSSDPNSLCAACNRLPELQAYGAGGHALMRFHYPASDLILEATAFGEFEDEETTEEYEPDMLVTNWEFLEEQPKEPANVQ